MINFYKADDEHLDRLDCAELHELLGSAEFSLHKFVNLDSKSKSQN